MKRLLITSLIIIILCCVLAKSSYAQNLGMDLSVGTKSIVGNSVPIDLSIISPVSVGDVKVQWVIPYGTTLGGGESTSFNANLTSTGELNDHVVIYYQSPGTYPITANISGIYNGSLFNKSQSVNLVIDNNMNVVNTSTASNIKMIVFYLLLLISFLIFLFNMKSPYIYLKTRFLGWLNKEGES